MKPMIRVLSIILVGVVLFSLMTSQITRAAEVIKEFEVKLNTIDDTIPDKIPVYSHNGKLMMSLKDVALITRCELTSSDDMYILKHARGMRTITLDVKNQSLSENKDSYKINVVKQNSKILVPAFPILTYLDATCKFDNVSETLSVIMPVHTFWEAFAFTLDKKMNVYSDKSKEKKVVLDLMVDMFATSSGQTVWEIVFNGADQSSAVLASTPFSQIAVSSADLMAKMSADYYNQAWLVMSGLGKKAKSENFHNQITMHALYDSYLMLLRFSLNFHESKIKYLESSGAILSDTFNIEQTSKSAKIKEIKDRADAISKTIDMINFCNPTAIKNYNDLESQATAFNEITLAKLNEITNQNESQKYWDSQYASVLKEYRDFIIQLNKSLDYKPSLNEPWRTISWEPSSVGYGYSYRDIDGNGINELIILTANKNIYGIYTHADGQPILLDNYWSRHSVYLARSNYLCVIGSGGALDRWSAIYQIASNGKELELVERFGIESIPSNETFVPPTFQYYYFDGKEQKKIIVTEDWVKQAHLDLPTNDKDGLKFISIKEEVEITDDSGVEMYSSDAFLSSFNPSTGIAKFDFIKLIESKDGSHPFDIINKNKRLRPIDLGKVNIIIDRATYKYITKKEINTDFETDLNGFKNLYSMAEKSGAGWITYCFYHITVDENGNPIKIKTTWRS